MISVKLGFLMILVGLVVFIGFVFFNEYASNQNGILVPYFIGIGLIIAGFTRMIYLLDKNDSDDSKAK